jgi:hypothetical protein
MTLNYTDDDHAKLRDKIEKLSPRPIATKGVLSGFRKSQEKLV